jgi:hypothetical protein
MKPTYQDIVRWNLDRGCTLEEAISIADWKVLVGKVPRPPDWQPPSFTIPEQKNT